VGYFNIPFSTKDQPNKKINKETRVLNCPINQMDLTVIFHPIATEYTFFSAAHATFSKMHHILDHKAVLTIKSSSTDHNGIKLEINSKGRFQDGN
jgi:hypothetical protein